MKVLPDEVIVEAAVPVLVLPRMAPRLVSEVVSVDPELAVAVVA